MDTDIDDINCHIYSICRLHNKLGVTLQNAVFSTMITLLCGNENLDDLLKIVGIL